MKPAITNEDWNTCLNVLRHCLQQPEEIPDEQVFKGLVTKLYKDARKRKRIAESHRQKAEDRKQQGNTILFQKNDDFSESLSIKSLPEISAGFKPLNKPKRCYICKEAYQHLHFFYHLLCPKCAALNFEKRNQRTNLNGQTALITGGRIKIGFELALKMLRDGARVIVTTRFPDDAYKRYSAQDDFREWAGRLHLYGLDLRNLSSLEQFISGLYRDFPSLEMIINNAAQTIKRPAAFYQHLLGGEQQTYLLEARQEPTNALSLSNPYFPIGKLDKDQQQIDLRPLNSWKTKLNEVSVMEMLEVQLVNTTAPFLLNSRLKGLLTQSKFTKKFIVNVSAMEGKFHRNFKSVFHPHTNMAKAALNMMTRTSAHDYVQEQIFMTSVDTGWVTDENPYPQKVYMREQGFVPPLDCVDGAARVYDPVVSGIEDTGTPSYGVFLKDYQPTDW
ncbi:SDR family NAD(P)-dependent oxidoreductase [Rapidithrix thailandica]|uniref:SDR family NAD(P)-dependent oxidoreductase n=1 Tax=Rapidithrix thailandica TaxID=413964 RepID=A0AAW9SK63_9BACT